MEFFKHAWHIVKLDFVAAIASFFRSGKLLAEVNSTLITLVPKIPNPSTVADFRPIACCNVVYKCITKVLANRLQACLNFLVNSNQTAFIKGRNISENVLLAHELVKGYHKNSGLGRCTIKADLRKAYDSINWNFIIMCLIAAGCPVKFVMWIRECITNPRFSISLNGSMVGYFKGGKGLRHGDPISPYLFVIAMDAFTRLMQRKIQEPTQFKFHPYCKALRITHLSFANDLLIYTATNLPTINLVKEGLGEFKVASGLDINPSKSEVFFSAVPQDVKWKILDVF